MTFKEAIYKVLIESGKPLHAGEITKRALAKGWLTTEGKTPIATVNIPQWGILNWRLPIYPKFIDGGGK